MIRPNANAILCEALRDQLSYDGKRLPEHFHLLSLVGAITDAFEAEGIDLEALIDRVLASQTVDITGGHE